MPKFDIVDCFVALGGDTLNTVPRTDVTAAEIAVLQIIHGPDAVHDIVPRGQVERSQRVERERLRVIYGNARNRDGEAHIERLYPGAAARVFETLDELELADVQFASTGRVSRGRGANQAAALADADTAVELVAANSAGERVEVVDAEDKANGLDEVPGDASGPNLFE